MSKNEIEIYLTLLKIGSVIVSEIARRSGLYRPYVYDTLKRLQEKGFVSFILKDGKKYYNAIEPSGLLESEKEKLTELQKIIPTLEQLSTTAKESANAELYVGKKVVRVIQKDILKTLERNGGENLVIGVDEKKFMETDNVVMEQFFEQMKKNKFKERVLVRKGDNYLPAYRSSTSYRFLPEEFFEPTSTFIYGEKVAIIIFSEPLYGIIMENKVLANAYKKQFNLMWKVARLKP